MCSWNAEAMCDCVKSIPQPLRIAFAMPCGFQSTVSHILFTARWPLVDQHCVTNAWRTSHAATQVNRHQSAPHIVHGTPAPREAWRILWHCTLDKSKRSPTCCNSPGSTHTHTHRAAADAQHRQRARHTAGTDRREHQVASHVCGIPPMCLEDLTHDSTDVGSVESFMDGLGFVVPTPAVEVLNRDCSCKP